MASESNSSLSIGTTPTFWQTIPPDRQEIFEIFSNETPSDNRREATEITVSPAPDTSTTDPPYAGVWTNPSSELMQIPSEERVNRIP